MVLRSKKTEEAIQIITMDPKVCCKLLTTHWKGYGVDVEALHGGFPLLRSAYEGSKMGSRGQRRLRWRKYFFDGSLDVFGVCRLIQEEEVGRWLPEGPTRQGAHPPPSQMPRLLLDLHSKSSGSRLFQKSRSRRFHSVWTPFDIPFLRNTEIGKKTAIRAGPPVSRLVPKMIIMCKIKPIIILDG